MKIDDLETHLDMTKRLWPKFGFHLQIKISFRYVQEHLQVAEDLRIKTDKQALKMYAVFAESLDLLGVGPHGDDVAVFSKDASKVCHVLHRLREEERRVCSDATGSATEENLEEALSAMLQGDGELPLSEEQSELFSAAEDGRGKGSWLLVPMRCSKLVYFFAAFSHVFGWPAGLAAHDFHMSGIWGSLCGRVEPGCYDESSQVRELWTRDGEHHLQALEQSHHKGRDGLDGDGCFQGFGSYCRRCAQGSCDLQGVCSAAQRGVGWR